MITRKLIACFDIRDGMVTKAHKFQDNIDILPAAEMARRMQADKIDGIVLYDIFASAEKRMIDLDPIRRVASEIDVPFTVGGGIRSVEDMHAVLEAGADKISIDSMAVRNPDLIEQAAKEFGSHSIVLSIQVKRVPFSNKIPSGYEVYIDSARQATGLDAVLWAKRGEELGAGEIVVNSIDMDGTHQGFELQITRAISEAVGVPIVASGGAGKPSHLVDVFLQTDAEYAIISSMLYSPRLPRNYTVKELKEALTKAGIAVEPW
ncbi:MAG: imidazole glycerol phosphate synthase subunit HisF [Clostridiales bacterium]|nr:imidazole glycerol phosphate synthase subunit HisF [Clostridiales bacterium]